METNAAGAAGIFLLGPPVHSMRNGKMATRSILAFYAPYLRAAWRSGPKNRQAVDARRATAGAQRSGLLLSTGLEGNAREGASRQASQPAASQLGAPLEFQSLQGSGETKVNSSTLPFEILASVAPGGASAPDSLAASSLSNAEPETEQLLELPAACEIAEIEERIMKEIATALDSRVEGQPAAEETVFADGGAMETGAIEQPVVDAPAHRLPPGDEKTAPRDLLSFYGLRQQPFDVTPDPAFLYFSPSHREALASLKQGIEYFRGFMMLVAEPGMGKTTLLNRLMEELSNSARVVFLFQTQCTSRELLCYILNELEVDHAGMDVVAMHRALNQALLEEMLRGRRFVLVVDEAQNLEEPVLETIRLLSDFETTHSKLIQIVLAGQPQLADTLMRPGLVQLRQRIAVLSNLKSLSAAQIEEYVEHRLRVSGRSRDALFTIEAIARIAEFSGGVPRSINNLCFNALLEAFHRGQETIGADVVKEVAARLNLESLVRRPETDAISRKAATPAESVAVNQPARIQAAQLTAEAGPDKISEPPAGPKPKPDAILAGNVTEKVRSQGWSKRPEYRILVTLERDPQAGLPVADRYYCCSLYLDESQAAALQVGKPVRIKIEQD
jgi:general secretion pathway protein A